MHQEPYRRKLHVVPPSGSAGSSTSTGRTSGPADPRDDVLFELGNAHHAFMSGERDQGVACLLLAVVCAAKVTPGDPGARALLEMVEDVRDAYRGIDENPRGDAA